MSRVRSPILLLVLLLAAGPSAAALCGVWCGEGGAQVTCHDAAPTITAATHACESPVVVAALPQHQGDRMLHAGPVDLPATVFELPRIGGDRRPGSDAPLVPFDRRPLATQLRI